VTTEFLAAEEADLQGLLGIYNHYVRESTATFHTQEVGVDVLRDLLMPAYPRFGSWKVVVDGRACGYVVLGRYKPREAYDGCAEVTIYLDPTIAGRGLGTLALEFLETTARDREFHSLIAIVCGENAASIRLFLKQGYGQCAHYHEVGRKFGRWLDVLSFEKLL
jgi:phosphinothricin acetyltransferase